MTDTMLTTHRLWLVRPEPGHLAPFTDFYASPRAAARGWLRTTAEAQTFFAALNSHWVERGFGWFVIQDVASGRPIGMCGPWVSPVMPEGEIAWSLWYDSDEGKGLAYEAAMAARDFAYESLGWKTAVSYISHDNLRSIALARRLGATEDGQWATPNGTRVATFRHPSPEALVRRLGASIERTLDDKGPHQVYRHAAASAVK